MLFQGLEVALAVIRGVVFPAGVIDADEFVGHSPAGLVVFAVGFAFLVVIIAFGPRLLFEGAAGVFMKSLAAELGARLCEPQRVDGRVTRKLVPTSVPLATRCGSQTRAPADTGDVP